MDYELDENKKVVISLDDISEDVYLLDKNNAKINFIEVKDGKANKISYLDKNSEVTKIVEVDSNGSIDKITYKNTSNKVPQVDTFTTIITNGEVTSEDYYDEDGKLITITEAEKESLKTLNTTVSNPLEYTLETSGDYEFKLLDKAENLTIKSIKVNYNNDVILASDISYNITKLTNKDVDAQINAYVIEEDGQKSNAQILNSETKYTFSENGTFTFNYKNSKDKDDYNVEVHTASVTWIDKVAPRAEVKYTALDNGNVKATLINESEAINIINREYVFTENGSFTFEFVDMAGNKGYATAVVDSIKKEEEKPNPEPVPDPIPQPNPDPKPTLKPDDNKNNNSNSTSNKNYGSSNNTNTSNKDDISSSDDKTSENENKDKDKPSKDESSSNDKKPEGNKTETNSREEEKNKSSILKYIICISVIIVLLVGIAYFLVNKNRAI